MLADSYCGWGWGGGAQFFSENTALIMTVFGMMDLPDLVYQSTLRYSHL